MSLALLDQYTATLPPNPGLFPLGDGTKILAQWELDASRVDAAALATPFAFAEATSIVLAELPGSKEHALVRHFENLLLGLAAGLLRVEPFDLTEPRFGELGQALLALDEGARYLGWIRDAKGTPFGLTNRRCLLSPHPRRLDGEWNALANGVRERRAEALAVLADFRESLRLAGAFEPSRIPWQRGLDFLADQAAPSSGGRALDDCEMVGPILVELPTPKPSAPTDLAPLWLPRLDRGRLDRFRGLIGLPVRRTASGLEITDLGGAAVARISMPTGAAGARPVLLGCGALTFVAEPSGPPSNPSLGALDQALAPLRAAMQTEGRTSAPGAAASQTGFFPDALRLFDLVQQAAAPPGVILGGRAARLALQGHPLPAETSSDRAALVIDANKTIVFVERVGLSPVHDLRALGLVLFALFVGAARIEGDAVVGDGTFAGLRGPLLGGEAHAFEPVEAAYAAVAAAPPDPIRKRLATLQRFVASYGDDGSALAKAAAAVATWAVGPVLPNGLPSKATASLTRAGVTLRTVRDDFAARAGGDR